VNQPFRFFIEYLCRWLPSSVETGLVKIGNPGPESPVFMTCNFSLTVRRLKRVLQGIDCYLLIAPSKGINVWCASAGHELNEHGVISVLKTSGIDDLVQNKVLIAPQLCAPGVDTKAVKEATGWSMTFGPVNMEHIPPFLDAGREKTDWMRSANFPFGFRMEMLLSMNFLYWLVIALILAVFKLSWIPGFTLIFWTMASFTYVLFPWIPGGTGWMKSFCVCILFLVILLLLALTEPSQIYIFFWLMMGAILTSMLVGFDLAGIVGPYRSDAVKFLHGIGIKDMGGLGKFSDESMNPIQADFESCIGCKTCIDVCPCNVYAFDREQKKAILQNEDLCFSCGACVKQCPASCLSLK